MGESRPRPGDPDLTRLAAGEVAGVVAEAVALGRRRAVELLAQSVTDAILAEVGHGSSAPTGPAGGEPVDAAPVDAEPMDAAPVAAESVDAEPVDAEPVAAESVDAGPVEPPRSVQQGLYAYAITRSGARPPAEARSVNGSPLRVVTSGDLSLVVSEESMRDLEVDEDDLSETGRLAVLVRGHDAVVRSAFETGPVLPLRFGTVVPDEAAARQLLDTYGDRARALLNHLASSQEWGVRLVRPVEEAPAGDRGSRGDRDRERTSGTDYLARRRRSVLDAEAAGEQATRAGDRIAAELEGYVADSLRRGGHPGSSLLLDMAYLVPTEATPRFQADTDRLARELEQAGLRLEVSGPWPPYSFASLETEASGREA